ncbi:ABC transporter substrate-binding protein [Thermodesulfitimonas sp.]
MAKTGRHSLRRVCSLEPGRAGGAPAGQKTAAGAALLAGLLLLLLLLGAGCGARPAALTVGLLPITDNLPFWVAEQKGYFRDAGVEVKFVSFPSAMERDSAFSAGQIDVAVGDLLAVAQMRQGGTKVKAIALCQGVRPEEGRFAILAAPGSGIKAVADLKNVPIACSLNTINEYVLDRLLTAGGFKREEIKKVAIPKIPVRLEALLNGTVKAAILPDPFAALAEAKGARLIIDDTKSNISQTVIIAREETVNRNLTGLKRLLAAYNRAVRDIQREPGAQVPLLKEKARVPEGALPGGRHGMKLIFSPAQLPVPADVQAVVDWLTAKGILKAPVRYDDLVEKRVLGG